MTETTAAPAHTFTADTIEYLGKVSEWLRSAPSGQTSYGEFFIESVLISFDGAEIVGLFEPDDWGDGTYNFVVGQASP